MLKRYPFDPTGQSTTNLVVGEIHHLDEDFDINMPRILFPRLGAYYNESLVVKLGDKVLKLNDDYLLTFFWQHATYMSGLPVSVAFQITNTKLKGTITIDYQVVGGEYQDRSEALSELMENFPQNTRNVFWDEVLEKPEAFIPTRHLHHINDVFGMSRFIDIIDQLRRSLEGQSVLKLKSVYSRFLALKGYVEDNLDDIDAARRGLTELNRQIEERLLNYVSKDTLTEEINQVYSDLQKTITETDKELERQITTLSTTVANNKDNLDNAVNQLSTSFTDYKSKTDKVIENLQNNGAESDRILTEQLNRIKNDLEEKIMILEAESREGDFGAELRLNQITNELRSQLEDLNLAYSNTYQKLAKSATKDEVKNVSDEVLNQAIEHLNNAFAELDNRINQVRNESNNGANSTDEKVTNLDNKIVELEKILESLNEYEKIVDNDRKHDEIIELINKLKTDTAVDLETKVNELNNLLEESKSAINSTVNTINETLNQAKQTLEDLEDRVDSNFITDTELQPKLDELKNTLSETIANVENTVLTQRDKEVELESRLNGLESTLDDIPERLEQLQETILSRIQNIDEFETVERVAEIRQELLDLIQNSINNINNDIENLLSNRDDVNVVVDNLSTELSNAKDAVDVLKDQQSELSTNLNNVNTQLGDLNNRVSSLSELESQVSENKEAIDNLNNRLDNTEEWFGDRYNGLDHKIDIVSDNLETYYEELKESVERNTLSIETIKKQQKGNYYDLSHWGLTTKDTDSWRIGNVVYKDSVLNGVDVSALHTEGTGLVDVTFKAKQPLDVNKNYRLSFYYYAKPGQHENGVSVRLGTIGNHLFIPLNFGKNSDIKEEGWYLWVGYFGKAIKNIIKATIYHVDTVKVVGFTNLYFNNPNLENPDFTIQSEVDDVLFYYPALYEVNGEEPTLLDNVANLQQLISNNSVDLTPVNERIDTLDTDLNKRIDELNTEIDEEELKRLVYLKMHEIVADKRIEEAGNIAIPDLVIYPDEANGVVFYDNVDGRSAYPISKMDNTLQTNELQRTVYTPNTVFEFDKTSVWTVPDLYDGLIAQVFVTAATRTVKLLNGNTLVYPPSTKMGYVRIKGGVNIPVEVGTISSFGSYITNDGVSSKGLIQPTYPIVVPFTTGLETAEDINSYHGKLGKVTVIL